MPNVSLEFFSNTVKEWESQGIVRKVSDLLKHLRRNENTSPCNINAFAIFSNKPRIVFNFAPLNELIKNDTNNVLSINDAFDTFRRARLIIYLKIDLANAYHQILLRKEDQTICFFTCNNI